MRPNRGFTLIEIVACMAALGIILALAVPAYGDAMARSHAAAARGALLATLAASVGHAANAGTRVVLCPATIDSCQDTMDWSGGWIAFADLDGNRQRSASEPIVHRAGALHEDVRLHSTKGRKRIVVHGNGGNAGSNVTFTLCDRRGADAAVTLVLANHGRLRAGAPKAAAARGCVEALRGSRVR